MDIRQKSRELLPLICHQYILSKIWVGAGYGAAAYIYSPSTIEDMELSTPQCLLLALLHSLVEGDVMSCCLLADVCNQVQRLRSRHLNVWLREDFMFPRQDIEKAMALLVKLLQTGMLKLPSHVNKIMTSLARMYGVQLSIPTMGDCSDCMSQYACNSRGNMMALTTEGGRSTKTWYNFLLSAARPNSCEYLRVLRSITTGTPLEEAAKNNRVSSAKPQLIYSATVPKQESLEAPQENKKNQTEKTPLVRVDKAGNVRYKEIFLKNGSGAGIVPEAGKGFPGKLAESRNPYKLKTFVKVGANLDSKVGDTMLGSVARFGNADELEVLKGQRLQGNIKNQNGITPSQIATDPFVVRMLISKGMNLDKKDKKGRTALMIAARNSKVDIMMLLLFNGASYKIKDKNGRCPLHHAAVGGCIGAVMALLDAGASVDDKDYEGNTPAFVAALNNKPSVLQLLVNLGADLNLRDCIGNGIIHRVAYRCDADVVTVLLDAGAAVDMKGWNRWTPLHCAAHRGHVPVAKVLLDRGANSGAKTADGLTPLMVASVNGHLEMVQLLVGHGELNDRTNWGDSLRHSALVGSYLRSKHT